MFSMFVICLGKLSVARKREINYSLILCKRVFSVGFICFLILFILLLLLLFSCHSSNLDNWDNKEHLPRCKQKIKMLKDGCCVTDVIT